MHRRFSVLCSLRPFAVTVIMTALLVGFTACAGSGSSRSGVTSNRIEIDKLSMDVGGQSAYEIVQQLRPQWLRKRGDSSFNSPEEISVYLSTNKTRFGSVSALRQLQAQNIAAIQYLDSREAQFEYGMDNTQGAIVVHMK